MRIEMAERKLPQFEKNWQGFERKYGLGRESRMNRVVFEVSYIGNPYVLFRVILFHCIAFLIIFYSRGIVRKYKEGRGKKMARGNIRFAAVFTLVCTVIFIRGYINTVVQYKSGRYIEIEGIVENYHLNARGTSEYFTVGGVLFTTPYISSWGYCQTSNNGGVIRGNGQHLRIRYVPTEDGKVIVYIEQLIPEEEID